MMPTCRQANTHTAVGGCHMGVQEVGPVPGFRPAYICSSVPAFIPLVPRSKKILWLYLLCHDFISANIFYHHTSSALAWQQKKRGLFCFVVCLFLPPLSPISCHVTHVFFLSSSHHDHTTCLGFSFPLIFFRCHAQLLQCTS